MSIVFSLNLNSSPRGQGPLNEDHLQMVFSCLSADQLSEIRTVCQFWKRVAEELIDRPLSVSDGVRRIFSVIPRFLGTPPEVRWIYDTGFDNPFDAPGLSRLERMGMVQDRFLAHSFSLQSLKWGRTPGTLVTIDRPLSYKISTGTVNCAPGVEVKKFDLRQGTETVIPFESFVKSSGIAHQCREFARVIRSHGEDYLDSFPSWYFLIILLRSKALSIYNIEDGYRTVGQIGPIEDIELARRSNDTLVLAKPVCDEGSLVVPCRGGILRVYNVINGALLHTLPIHWDEEPVESRFFTKIVIQNGYIAAALSNGRIDLFRGGAFVRSFQHLDHVVSDFSLGKNSLVAIFYEIVMRPGLFPTTIKAWDLGRAECLHEQVFKEGPIALEYVEYKRLVCECNNGKLLVLDPFLIPETPSFGRRILNGCKSCLSTLWHAFRSFIRWLLQCYFH